MGVRACYMLAVTCYVLAKLEKNVYIYTYISARVRAVRARIRGGGFSSASAQSLEIDASGLLGAACALEIDAPACSGPPVLSKSMPRAAWARLVTRNRCLGPARCRLCTRNRCHQACSVPSKHRILCSRPARCCLCTRNRCHKACSAPSKQSKKAGQMTIAVRRC